MIIRIKNLRLRTIIGVNPWEKTEPQAIIINAELEFDGTAAAISDRVEDTVDYRAVSKGIIEHVETSRYELIEALAGNLLQVVFSLDTRIKRVRLEIDKPNAIRSADSTSVEASGER